MSKRRMLWLVLAMLPVLLFATGCNDSNADAVSNSDASEITKSVSDKCAGCPDAQACLDQAPAKTEVADHTKCSDSTHPADCPGGEECTPDDCAKCPHAAKCADTKTEAAADTPAAHKCSGH
jgi:hypothetical protein